MGTAESPEAHEVSRWKPRRIILAILLGSIVFLAFWFPAWYERKQALSLARAEKWSEAKSRLQQILDKKSNDFEVCVALVKIHIAESAWAEAAKLADHCCSIRPEDPESYKQRMMVYRGMNNIPKAMRDALRAVELDPTNERFRLETARWLQEIPRYEKAEQVCREGLARHPGNLELSVLLANLRHKQGDDAEASAILDELLKVHAVAEAQLLRGILFLRENQPARATPLLRAALDQEPDRQEALYQLSVALERSGLEKEALVYRKEYHRRRGKLPWFEDVTDKAGLAFQHFNSITPMLHIQETLGSGVGWIDYDNDGWLDLFCVQSGPVRPEKFEGPLPTSKFYRNNRDGTFADITAMAGLARAGYGMGCGVGDYDNDGFDDLLVTYLGEVVLYHNEADGRGGRRFVDATSAARLSDPHFATSCAWGDVDNDGFLDLYICNYVELDLENYPNCRFTGGKRFLCGPQYFPRRTNHQLYRNNGNGTFTEVSAEAGIAAAPLAAGLVVLMVDVDDDGWLDIFVGNDQAQSYLFHNQGQGKFVEKALASGVAYGPGGELVAGMGVEAGDLSGSGRPDLFITNFQAQPNMLYRNLGNLIFKDWNEQSGLGPPSLSRLKFGTVFADFDLDGLLDVAVANGHVEPNALEFLGVPFAQEAQFFLGQSDGRFRDVSNEVGSYFRRQLVGRGVAWADYDNDGLPDLLFSHNGGPLVLLRNASPTENNWLRLELVGDGKKSNRNAVGSRVEVESANGKRVHFIKGGGSYLSASDRRLVVGLGSASKADRVTVTWPSGRKQIYRDLPARSWQRLKEGNEAPEEIKLSKDKSLSFKR